MFDWNAFLSRLRTYPTGLHRILAACPSDRVEAAEEQLGSLPDSLEAMVTRFNGAELFIIGLPLVTLLRISSVPPLSPIEWAPRWSIEELTTEWRAGGNDRNNDWAIAMTNYGGLVLLNGKGTIQEWDTGGGSWVVRDVPFADWIEGIMNEGDSLMSESVP